MPTQPALDELRNQVLDVRHEASKRLPTLTAMQAVPQLVLLDAPTTVVLQYPVPAGRGYRAAPPPRIGIVNEWPTSVEQCFAFADEEDDASRCIRPRGHADSHTTARGACWPNTTKPHQPRYVGPRTSITTIVNPRRATRDEWSQIL
jgi:hypothetical protein